MPSIVGKRRGKHTYYYLVESARVGGKPRIVSQEYLGTAEEVMGKLSGQRDALVGTYLALATPDNRTLLRRHATDHGAGRNRERDVRTSLDLIRKSLQGERAG